MKKIMTVDGNEACAYTSYMFTEVAGIYPITPSSPMAEHIDEWSSNKCLNLFNDSAKVVEMQSEAGAAGLVHGSLQSGLLTSTYTASQGLLLMIPNMYKIAGEMLPCTMHVAARSLSTHALSILGDHQDIYAARMTGFAMLASSSVQDAALLSGVAHLSTIKSSIPFMHFFDGFRTSHEINKITVLEQDDYKALLDYEALGKFRQRSLGYKNNVTIGTAQNDDIYFQAMEVRNKFYNQIPVIVDNYMQEINKLAGTDYQPFNYYGSDNATKVIAAMGSVCQTIKEVIDHEKSDLGLIEVHLYRPFSTDYLKKVLPKSVTKIAVLDRTKEFGSVGEPLYLDVKSALADLNIAIVGGRYGLSSKNTTPAQIKAVFDMLDNPIHNFTIGIDDDVTNLSLKIDENYKIKNNEEFLFYGYGSDGMISASKSIIKIIGDNTNKYVQGYFQYDSKKSGGVTVSHLRFSDQVIHSTYYVENPKLVVVTKDNYLNEFDIIKNIEKNGTLIINTTLTDVEFNQYLSNENKYYINKNNLSVYIINAYELARKVGLKNKISMIMESVILRLSNVVDYDLAVGKLNEYVKNKFRKKGEEIVNANLQAINEADNYIRKLTFDEIDLVDIYNKDENILEIIEKRKGNELPVSAFLPFSNGSFSKQDINTKKEISDITPKWISENCIQCNQCALVCPHAVIRPFLLNEEEYNKAPSYVQDECIKPIEKNLENYYYILGVSIKNCTGCGLCVKVCPGKNDNKALIFNKTIEEYRNHKQQVADYLFANIKDKELINANTLKGCQFKKPEFAFHGACAGCGETSYIKLLTQLVGKKLIIANATGCSSIYGASIPNIPYSIPWASSLFEDNAEYGYGMLIANNVIKQRLIDYINKIDNTNINYDLLQKWLKNIDDFDVTLDVCNNLNYEMLPKEIVDLKEYLVAKEIWTIGGDGWAYDIGFSGIDHVLSSNDNVNILVLDSQVYSNTGGQSSKASPKGAIASFATSGKSNSKKDLARIALAYPNAYVAQVSLGANPMQVIKAFNEARNHKGPSIIIAYTPCISHGIKGGMENSFEQQKLATQCGYFPTFRYNPENNKFILDSKKVDFDKYYDFLNTETRYINLKKVNPQDAETLLEQNKEDAIKRYKYYVSLEKEN